MNLIQMVCKVLDFPEDYASVAIHEACSKEKLQNTWMKVNGKVMYVDKFLFDTNEIITKDKNRVVVTDLDVFLPEPGLYSKGDSCCIVQKLPKKQWKKSFNYNSYVCGFIYTLENQLIFDYPEFIDTATLVKFWLNPKGYVYYYTEKVAKLTGETLEVSKPLYYQEILDWVTKEKLPWKVQ